MATCKRCGREFPRTTTNKHTPGYYHCCDCARAMGRQYDARRKYKPRPPVDPAERLPVRVVGVAAHLANQEERDELRIAYFDSVFHYHEFTQGVVDRSFDGLRVAHGERLYDVRAGALVAVDEGGQG